MDRNPNTATLAPNNLFTLARDYGDQIQQWNGVDLTMNARIRRDLYVQGGMSTGRTLTDNWGTVYGERLNQLDFRIAKLLRAGRWRTSANVDLYNAFNADTVLAENAAYAGAARNQWRVPTTIVTARFAKFSVQVDF